MINKLDLNKLSKKKLKLAVVGHVEWISFISVDKLPKHGEISHGEIYLETVAGGGAVTAIQMNKKFNHQIEFFTALGRDKLGEICYEQLAETGIKLNIAWKNEKTRKGISFLDQNSERSITVIGKRLMPTSFDLLPWAKLKDFDGVFVSATDTKGLNFCRRAKIMTITPRLGLEKIKKAGIFYDAIIGSDLDPEERFKSNEIKPMPKYCIRTRGKDGGISEPGGIYSPYKLNEKVIDSYGCGDSFAAGLTIGLAANLNLNQAIDLGTYFGAKCACHLGPY